MSAQSAVFSGSIVFSGTVVSWIYSPNVYKYTQACSLIQLHVVSFSLRKQQLIEEKALTRNPFIRRIHNPVKHHGEGKQLEHFQI